MTWWWVSSRRMTFDVEVTDGRIVDAAPIARKFIQQSFSNLLRWMERQGGLRVVRPDRGPHGDQRGPQTPAKTSNGGQMNFPFFR